jgi:hypothetical protein
MHAIKAIDKPQPNKYFLRYLPVILFLGLHFLPGISQSMDLSGLKPYGGLEYVHRTLAFQEGYGKGDFKKSLPQGNAFLGIQFNEYLGLEAGYLFSNAVKRTVFSTEGRQIFGEAVLNRVDDKGDEIAGYNISRNKINLTGPQISIVGRLPLGMSGFSLIGSIGLSRLTLKAKTKVLGTDELPVFLPLHILEWERSFCVKKVVPKAMFGLGYQFTNRIGIRILIGYEKTKQFKNLVPKEQGPLRMTLKNNTLCSIGLTAQF